MLKVILIGKLPKRDIRVYDSAYNTYIYFVCIGTCESSVV